MDLWALLSEAARLDGSRPRTRSSMQKRWFRGGPLRLVKSTRRDGMLARAARMSKRAGKPGSADGATRIQLPVYLRNTLVLFQISSRFGERPRRNSKNTSPAWNPLLFNNLVVSNQADIYRPSASSSVRIADTIRADSKGFWTIRLSATP
jgi:hypothetical protein